LAQVFFFHLEEGFRVLFLQPRDKESEKAANEIADAFEHCRGGVVFEKEAAG